jgi:hypothetical protein
MEDRMPASNVMRPMLAAAAMMCVAATVAAQSAVMPLPHVVSVDGQGTTFAQVIQFTPADAYWPMVVLDVAGTSALLVIRPHGPVDTVANASAGGETVYFTSAGCMGDALVNPAEGFQQQVGAVFGVAGPDATLGTYRLYRSTTMTAVRTRVASAWANGVCQDGTANVFLLPAEEMVPNPLEGYVGPTVAVPDQTWSISGGTRIIPPAP